VKFGVACNKLDDSHKASRKAAEEAVRVSGKPALTIIFTTDSYDHKVVLESVKEVVGDSKILGFCGGGIIFAEDMLQQAVAVGILSGIELSVATSLQEGISQDSYGAGHRAGEELLDSGISKGLVIVLPDGLTGNKTEIMRGLYNVMGPDFIYTGGSSGGSPGVLKTYQFTEAGVKSDALAVALLDGVSIHAGIVHGWKPTKEHLVITRSEGKRVYEIDGYPAFDIYSQCLGADTVDSFIKLGKQYPLGIPDVSGNFLIRDPRSVNDDKSINFQSEIPSNLVANIMEGSVMDQIEADKSLVNRIIEECAEPQFALIFDCMSRFLLMGIEFKEELRIIRESIGREVPVLGALTYGEIGSYVGAPMFHNKSIAVVVLSSE
jgi:hypothetical protein